MSYSTKAPAVWYLAKPKRDIGKSVLFLVLFLVIAYAVAAFGALTTIGAVDGWYASAAKVPWNPPNWVFGPVWAALYTLMAVAAWLVWRERRRDYDGPALTLYVGQLFLNSVWTPVFFGGFDILGPWALWVGLAVILLLDLCVLATIFSFAPISRTAAFLLLPYLLWILYATSLNWGLAVLNS